MSMTVLEQPTMVFPPGFTIDAGAVQMNVIGTDICLAEYRVMRVLFRSPDTTGPA
jgi:hypothetical protein